jgi:hypothetical protein
MGGDMNLARWFVGGLMGTLCFGVLVAVPICEAQSDGRAGAPWHGQRPASGDPQLGGASGGRPLFSPPLFVDRSTPISERPFAKPFIDRGPSFADRPLAPIGGGQLGHD